ncbi:uncharacterized protein DSM5745_02631 [Aspergillus mulundensis]|uniref:Uncharacterized protein n=1 Tax=Aspergillus mulundensis TaxID=1810919 RepID=A0A3D8SX22_9EURO|nr:hypothetical protein DSM5745_02631 [Aspergillus mulundensis]RDW90856.1 hypothetical protein DSM5745_02631 [Aspergillus mulundensis]
MPFILDDLPLSDNGEDLIIFFLDKKEDEVDTGDSWQRATEEKEEVLDMGTFEFGEMYNHIHPPPAPEQLEDSGRLLLTGKQSQVNIRDGFWEQAAACPAMPPYATTQHL